MVSYLASCREHPGLSISPRYERRAFSVLLSIRMQKGSQRIPISWLWLLAAGSVLLSCKREWLAPRGGELRWQPDTVRFDSLFSTVLSPTQRLWIYNPHSHPVPIKRIFLEKGGQSPFSFIWNGVSGPLLRNVELPARDSVQVFLSLRDTVFSDQTREDALVLEGIGGGMQRIPLRATLIAAYVYRDFGFDSITISLPSDKPIVIDGYFYVGPMGVLRIPAGARLYFSGRRWPSGALAGELMSGIYVAGRLEVLGTVESPVTFQGWRLEPYYTSAFGQWMGLWLLPSAQSCEIRHATIRQASIGIRIDSTSPAAFPKLRLHSALISDAANYGVLALGFSPNLPPAPILEMTNTLIYRCGQACAALLGGGWYRFVHNSLIYDQGDIRRGQTTLIVTDFLRTENGVQTYPLKLSLLNTLLWSSKANSYGSDLRGAMPEVEFDHCALRQEENRPGGINFFPADPQLGPASEAYPLREGSPLINAGRYEVGVTPPTDRVGRPRDNEPDIGCYEYLR